MLFVRVERKSASGPAMCLNAPLAILVDLTSTHLSEDREDEHMQGLTCERGDEARTRERQGGVPTMEDM
jgi:hypothetical protein